MHSSKLISRNIENKSNNQSNWNNWLNSEIRKTKKQAKDENEPNNNNDDDDEDNSSAWEECTLLEEARADINTKETFSKFEFEPDWIKTKEYWDKDFEARYEKLMSDPHRQPLKVIITPHR